MNLEQLITEVKAKVGLSQQCFYNQFAERMYELCRRYVKSPEDAEERMLDGFAKFFATIDSFTYMGDASLYTWVKKIMVNECMMHLRKKELILIEPEEEALNIPLEKDMLDGLSVNHILKAIAQLPDGYRAVFNMYVIEGFEHPEIAQLLKITVNTSKTQLWKAKNMLQKILSDEQSYHDARSAR